MSGDRDKKNKDKDKDIDLKKRKLCKLVNNDFLIKHMREYKELVLEPGYICRKCGRTAQDCDNLCDSEKIGQ